MPPARLAGAARVEDLVVHAGRDDLDAVAVRAVEADELLALVRGRRQDQVGAADGLLLDARPLLGVVVDAGVGLHPGERVERRDERDVELVLQPVAERAGDPVVRVERVVAEILGREVVQRRAGQRLDEVDERVLRHRLGRARVQVDDPEPGLDLHHVGLAGMVAAGEHVAFDAGPRQRRRERSHVHVHPTTVARARLREGRRVHAEDGETAQGHNELDPNRGVPGGPLSTGRPAQAPRSTVPGCSRSCWKDR